MALTDNLLSYWKLDDNSNDAVGSNNGTDSNISYAAAKINNGASFNGSSSKITHSASGFPTGNAARSVNFWVKLNSTASGRQVFLYGTYSSGQVWCVMMSNSIFVQGYMLNASGASSTVLSTGTWYMCTVTMDGSGNIAYYLNGSADGTATIATLNTTASGGIIGNGWDGYFSGMVDEIGFWSRVLSSTEVSQLYNSGNGLPYPLSTTNQKKIGGVDRASIKKIGGVSLGSCKKIGALTKEYFDEEKGLWLPKKPQILVPYFNF